MLLPKKEDTIHKAWLYRVLKEISDNAYLNSHLYFKGGTYAAMAGYLNRFSIDLDFDLALNRQDELVLAKKELEKIITKLDLIIKDKSQRGFQYFLKYKALTNKRNTLKVEALFPAPKANLYEPVYFSEIDRTLQCQTKETMFANKLVAIIDRYEQQKSLAGRDLYDIHQFFLQGLGYNKNVIKERRNINVEKYFTELTFFIQKYFNDTVINQDLNTLLTIAEFQKIRKILLSETLMFLKDEIKRIK